MDDDDDLLDGDGSEADSLNSSGGGAAYIANQSPLDVIDNGQVTQSGGATTVAPPSWMTSLTSLFSGGASAVTNAMGAVTGTGTTPAHTVTTPGTGTAASTIGGMSTTTLMIIGGIVLLLGALLFFRKHK
jgi:LPXTG-motif cell wall-anchored protein